MLVSTPRGEARVWMHLPTGRARTILLLGHGAGRGADTPDLMALAERLPAAGVAVVRVDQPWVLAGRRVAAPPAHLDEAWLTVVAAVQKTLGHGLPLVVGGRSAGARVSCRTAHDVGAVAVVALAFPLHPPGRPERSRVEELSGCGVRALVVQGSRDPFGRPDEVTRALRGATRAPVEVLALPEADHSFGVPARAAVTAAQTMDALVAAVRRFLLD